MNRIGNIGGYSGTNSPGFKIGTGTMWTGSGVPADVDGSNGDFYFRTDGKIYKRLAGAWTEFAGAASHSFEESTLQAKTANYTLVDADKGKTTVFNGNSLTCTAPVIDAASHGQVFFVQNINASALTVSGVVGLTSLAENESAILIVDNTNSEVRTLSTNVEGSGGGSGAWSIKESGMFSDVTHKDFIGLSKTTRILIESVVVNTSSTYLRAKTSSNNGSSFDGGAQDYKEHNIYSYNDNVAHAYASWRDYLSNQAAINNDTGDCYSFDLFLMDPSNTTKITLMRLTTQGMWSTDDLGLKESIYARNATAKVDAVRIYPHQGTFSGKYTVLELN